MLACAAVIVGGLSIQCTAHMCDKEQAKGLQVDTGDG